MKVWQALALSFGLFILGIIGLTLIATFNWNNVFYGAPNPDATLKAELARLQLITSKPTQEQSDPGGGDAPPSVEARYTIPETTMLAERTLLINELQAKGGYSLDKEDLQSGINGFYANADKQAIDLSVTIDNTQRPGSEQITDSTKVNEVDIRLSWN